VDHGALMQERSVGSRVAQGQARLVDPELLGQARAAAVRLLRVPIGAISKGKQRASAQRAVIWLASLGVKCA